MSHILKTRGIFGVGLALVVVLLGSLFTPVQSASAVANAAGFRPGYIVSDATFYQGDALDANSVQAFLNEKVPTCRAGYVCLKDFRQNTTNRAADAMCSAYQGASGESAAQIIAKVGQACGISQKAILTLLQKEQGLVNDSWPSDRQYRSAMGYGCPDTADCDTEYYGFFQQVYKGASQLKRYGNPAGSGSNFSRYPVGRTSAVQYNPNAACGSGQVLIENKATAALYYYTPYQPNTAALTNLYGIGDNCSAYGNRNFWRIFSDWFGSPTGGTNPVGGMDSVGDGDIRVRGWAIDPDSSEALKVHVYVNGAATAVTTANASRPDVGRAYPGYGDNHGIDVALAAKTGTYNVCAYAINVSGGTGNTLLGCNTVSVVDKSPIGGMNAFTPAASESITVNGWTIDPETADPLRVHVYVDGVVVGNILANANRPDVGRVHPNYGAAHGIDTTFAVAPGTHNVCAYGINVGAGSNTTLGCQTVTVASMSPIGGMNVETNDDGIAVNGWTLDPSSLDTLQVHTYIDGTIVGATTANANRPDIARHYPAYGAARGINVFYPLAPGAHSVCAYAINVGVGSNTLLGCQNITVPVYDPFGGMDVTTSGSAVSVNGWTIDPDTTNAIDVHVYMDGAGAAITTANASRPDVGRAYPAFGDNHGIKTSFTAARGNHNVCAYAINVGKGKNNTLLGCQTVSVAG
jgi:hypothetical protein